MLELFKAGWILVGCQSFYYSSAGKKFLRVFTVIAMDNSYGFDYAMNFKTISISIVIILGVNRPSDCALGHLSVCLMQQCYCPALSHALPCLLSQTDAL